jgi:hypothetical protein
MFFLLVGFAVLFIEVRYLHAGIVQMNPVAWAPIVSAGLGVLAALLGLFGGTRIAAGVIFILISVSGVAGVYFHTKGDVEQIRKNVVSERRSDVLAWKMEGKNEPPPALAPLAMTGLCLIGVVVALGERKK